jgi:hypothetical protein
MELIRTTVERHAGISVFARIGERSREGHEAHRLCRAWPRLEIGLTDAGQDATQVFFAAAPRPRKSHPDSPVARGAHA